MEGLPNPDLLSLKHLLGERFHPLQPELILAPEYEVACVTGMGAGKTYAACVAAIRHAAKYPGARVLICRKTYNEMLISTKHTFFEIIKNKGLQRYFVKPKLWDVREGTNYARMTNGSEFFFSNLDEDNLDKFKNVEYSLVIIDQAEEIEFDIYQLLLLRCRLTAVPYEDRHVMALANDEGDGWLRDRFLVYTPEHGHPTGKASRRLIRGIAYDNPYLDEGLRAQYLTLPAELQERWVFATMKPGTTRLLPSFQEVDPIVVPPHWPRFLGIDPARSSGVTCALWLTVNPDPEPYGPVLPNAPHFFAEYWEQGRETEVIADEINALCGPYNMQARVMDSTAWHAAIKSARFGTISIADLYVRAGLGVVPSQGDEWTRIGLILSAIRRGLTVSSECAHLLQQAPQYRVRGQRDLRGKIVRIVGKQKFHAIDACGYALAYVPTRVVAVDMRLIRPAFEIGKDIDEASKKHWEQVLRGLPKVRGKESAVTYGDDELELHREDDTSGEMGPEEDQLY